MNHGPARRPEFASRAEPGADAGDTNRTAGYLAPRGEHWVGLSTVPSRGSGRPLGMFDTAALAGADQTRSADRPPADAPDRGRPTREAWTILHATSHGGALRAGIKRARLIGRPPMCQVRGARRVKLGQRSMQRLTVVPWWVGIKRARLIGRLPMCQVPGARRAKLGQYPMQRLTVAPWWVGIERARVIRRRPVHQVLSARRAKLGQHSMQRPTVAPPSASRGTADTARDNTLVYNWLPGSTPPPALVRFAAQAFKGRGRGFVASTDNTPCNVLW